MKILIVDHSPIYHDILLQALQGYGLFGIEMAKSAATALIAITERHFNFLIISGQLQDGEGTEFAHESIWQRSQPPLYEASSVWA